MHEHSSSYDDVADIHRRKQEEENNSPSGMTISDPGDHAEKHAENIAGKVADGENVSIGNDIHSKSSESKEKTDPQFAAHLASSKGGGQYMDDATKSEMESRMGTDFNGVKIHTGGNANDHNGKLGSDAFTNEKDIFFGHGKYNPETPEGKELLAHELVHTKHGKENEIFRQKEQLGKLRDYDESRYAKEKEKKQEEVNLKIADPLNALEGKESKEDSKNQKQVQRESRKLEKIEKRINKQREKYIHNLERQGVEQNDAKDPFEPAPDFRQKERIERRITRLYGRYDKHAEAHKDANEKIKERRLGKLSDDQKQDVEDYDLKLPGVQSDAEISEKTAAERTEELLYWANADARTSYQKYHSLVEEESDESYAKKEEDLNRRIAQNREAIIKVADQHDEHKQIWMLERERQQLERDQVELMQQRNASEKRRKLVHEIDLKLDAQKKAFEKHDDKQVQRIQGEIDQLIVGYNDLNQKHDKFRSPFERAKKIMNEYLDDSYDHAKDISNDDLKLTIKYFLEGNPKEDDKLLLVRFMQKFISDKNVNEIVGTGEDKIQKDEIFETLEEYEIEPDDKYFQDDQRKEKHREAVKQSNTRGAKDNRKKKTKEWKDKWKAEIRKKFTGGKRAMELLKLEFQTPGHKRQLKKDEQGISSRKDFVNLDSFKETFQEMVENSENKNRVKSEEMRGGLNAKGWELARENFLAEMRNMDPVELDIAFAGFGAALHYAEELNKAIDDFEKPDNHNLDTLKQAAWEYYINTGHTGDETEFKDRIKGKQSAKEVLNLTLNPGGEFLSPGESIAELREPFFELVWETFKKTTKTDQKLKNALRSPWAKAGVIAADAALWFTDAFINKTVSPGQGAPLLTDILTQLPLFPDLKKTITNKVFKKGGKVSTNTTTFGLDFRKSKKLPFMGAYDEKFNTFGDNSLSERSYAPLNLNFGFNQFNNRGYEFSNQNTASLLYHPGTQGGNQKSLEQQLDLGFKDPFNIGNINPILSNKNPDMLSLLFNSQTDLRIKNFYAKAKFDLGMYNLTGEKEQQLKGFGYDLNAGWNKKLGKSVVIHPSAGISGAYTNSGTDNTSSTNFMLNMGVDWKNWYASAGYRGNFSDDKYRDMIKLAIMYKRGNFSGGLTLNSVFPQAGAPAINYFGATLNWNLDLIKKLKLFR